MISKRAIIKTTQIIGTNGESLYDEIKDIVNDAIKEYNSSVDTVVDLPSDDPVGSMRLVESESRYYRLTLEDNIKVWKPIQDIKTEERRINFNLDNGQSIINTHLVVGVFNGVSSLDTVTININGQGQNRDTDFILSKNANDELIIEWVSQDFQIETTDEFQVVFNMLLN